MFCFFFSLFVVVVPRNWRGIEVGRVYAFVRLERRVTDIYLPHKLQRAHISDALKNALYAIADGEIEVGTRSLHIEVYTLLVCVFL